MFYPLPTLGIAKAILTKSLSRGEALCRVGITSSDCVFKGAEIFCGPEVFSDYQLQMFDITIKDKVFFISAIRFSAQTIDDLYALQCGGVAESG